MGTGAGKKGRWRPRDNGERRQNPRDLLCQGGMVRKTGGFGLLRRQGEGREAKAADDTFQLKKK